MNVLGRLSLLVVGVTSLGVIAARTPDPVREREIARIRAHFDSVVGELRARDVSALTPAARGERVALISELERYRDAGAFPHNYDFPGELVPYFVDRKTGVLCAVANLLDKTGRRDIVDRVAHGDNNVRVMQLRGDTAFSAWLDMNGLTLTEAARIQVPYAQPPSPVVVGGAIALGVASLTAVAGSVVTGVWNATGNADGHRTRVSKLGVGMGIVTSVVGAALLESSVDKRVSGALLGAGASSMALSIRSMNRHSAIMAQKEAASRAVAEAKLEPTIDARGAAGARVGLSIGF